VGQAGPLQDNWASLHAAGDLAEQLLAEGITAMKVWPFDRYAHQHGGLRISWSEVEEGMKPLREIRDRVGKQMDIMIEGHAFFHLPAARRLAEALREIQPMWLEDVLRVDNVATLADFRRQAGLPIAASEMLLGRRDIMEVLHQHAADYLMVDPTWSGGISESRRAIALAESYNVPVTMHDCTGPLTLFSGLHLAAASSNVVLQETVRAHIRSFYERLIETLPRIEGGFADLPGNAGLGVRFHESLFTPGQRQYRRSERK
jgi:L-alanine-DL-glutamate epimerase-like enolase superfamily enzyme